MENKLNTVARKSCLVYFLFVLVFISGVQTFLHFVCVCVENCPALCVDFCFFTIMN